VEISNWVWAKNAALPTKTNAIKPAPLHFKMLGGIKYALGAWKH